MKHTRCAIIGAGHSGLAMSQCLSAHAIDHVIFERGEIANSWKYERWDSLRLLTPNWQARLPGFVYSGDDPDGFLTMPETIRFIKDYAAFVSAPVKEHTRVTEVTAIDSGYELATARERWLCDTLVIASGVCNLPQIPALAQTIPDQVNRLTPMEYRNPGQLDEGGVLVVGASASGLQIAEEIHLSGRPVTLSVGEHVRVPRTYRGRDIQWWMDASGVLEERYDQVDDIVRARNVPSPQLIGTPERRTLDLNRLTELGVRLRGRLVSCNAGKLSFSGSLRNICALADLKMQRLLKLIDEWASENGLDTEVDAPQRYHPTEVEESPPLVMDLAGENIKTILWATGYKPDLSWLKVPILDRKGKIKHDGGVVVESPGLYCLGATFLRRRKSSFIHGAEDDCREVSQHLIEYLKHKTNR